MSANTRNAPYQYFLLMRFHKPIGIFLLLWPTLWALWIAAKGSPNLLVFTVFVVGVILMRAAGCVINDIADRNFDRKVARTKSRPLTNQQLSLSSAIALFIALIAVAFILVCQLNTLTIMLAFVAVCLATLYPFMKRYTHWPQLILGLAFSWGIPMAFAAQTHHIPGIAWLLFITTVLWTITYDTEYAMADRDDDLHIGIKSTAILFGKYDRLIIAITQMMVIGLLILIGWQLSLAIYFYLAVSIAAILCIYQQYLIRHRHPKACHRAFLNNHWFGLVIFLGIFLSYH